MMSASRPALWLELSRPFTLVAPALGVLSGAITAAGAEPRDSWTIDFVHSNVIYSVKNICAHFFWHFFSAILSVPL